MQRFVAQPQGSKTLRRNSCAMENFQIEQPTSRGKRNVVALGLLGLVAAALLLTPGALTGLAMADGFNGGAHLSASTNRICTTFDLSVVLSAQNATTFAGCSEIVRWGICHRVRAVGRLAGRWLRWRSLRSCPVLCCPAARDIGRQPMACRGTVDFAPGGRDTRRSRKFETKLIKTSRCLIRSLVAALSERCTCFAARDTGCTAVCELQRYANLPGSSERQRTRSGMSELLATRVGDSAC